MTTTTSTAANLIGDATRLLRDVQATLRQCSAASTRCATRGEDMDATDAALVLLTTETERILAELGDARRWDAPLRLAVRCEQCDADMGSVEHVTGGDEIALFCAHSHAGFAPSLLIRVGAFSLAETAQVGHQEAG